MALVKTVGGTRYGQTPTSRYRPTPGLSGLLSRANAPYIVNPATQPAQPLPTFEGTGLTQKLGLSGQPSTTSPLAGRGYLDASRRIFQGTPGPPNPGLASSAAAQGIDYSADPILQKIRAIDQQARADAQSQAQAQTKQQLIQYGYDPALDQTGDVSRLFPDAATRTAAQQNPFSVLAQLAYGNTQTGNALENQLNQSNPFYSSFRGDQLAKLAHDYQLAQAQAANARGSALSGIAQQLAGAYQQADYADIQAEQDAYNRALEWALAHPVAPPSGGPDGTTTPPTGTPIVYTGVSTGVPNPQAPTQVGGMTPNAPGAGVSIADLVRRMRGY